MVVLLSNHCLPSDTSPSMHSSSTEPHVGPDTASGLPPGLPTAVPSTCTPLPTPYHCIIKMVAMTERPWVGDGVTERSGERASAFQSHSLNASGKALNSPSLSFPTSKEGMRTQPLEGDEQMW